MNSQLLLHLGDYKGEEIHIHGAGFEKVNLITGMKGGGKSHIAKGIIAESLKAGMSAVVFDINDEYGKITDNTMILSPGVNLKFRIDFMKVQTLLKLFENLAPFPEKTAYQVYAKLPKLINEYIARNKIPDMEYLKSMETQIIEGHAGNEAVKNMRMGYRRSVEILESYKIIMSQEEAAKEDDFIKGKGKEKHLPDAISLRSAFNDMLLGQPEVLIFQLGGLQNRLQKAIVSLVLDHLHTSCDKQTKAYHDFIDPENKSKKNNDYLGFPIYPTVFFEEAHMYMDVRDIDELIPIIRHIGINVFFVTNTPGALPDSVFRLIDNLIMTQMTDSKDINYVANCGLIDKETLIGFAKNLKKHHALFLSAKNGATQNFPLVFHVRNFGLPPSGETRSQWKAMDALKKKAQDKTEDKNLEKGQSSSKKTTSQRKAKSEEKTSQNSVE